MGMLGNPKILAALLGSGALAYPDDAEGMYIGPKAKGWEGLMGKFSSLMDRMERAEISDKMAHIIDWPVEGESMALREVMRHPRLFENYPSLQHIRVREGGTGASWSGWGGGGRKIQIGQEGDPREPLLHEIQHAIQEKEGWARGGSPAGMSRTARELVREAEGRIFEIDIKLASPKTDIDTRNLLMARKANLEQEARELTKEMIDGALGYRRLSGEIEARDTASRMGLNSAQRGMMQPYSGQGIPLKDTITKMGVAAPVGAVLAEQMAEKRKRAEGEALQDAINPFEYLSPARWGGGLMNMGVDALLRYFTGGK